MGLLALGRMRMTSSGQTGVSYPGELTPELKVRTGAWTSKLDGRPSSLKRDL